MSEGVWKIFQKTFTGETLIRDLIVRYNREYVITKYVISEYVITGESLEGFV